MLVGEAVLDRTHKNREKVERMMGREKRWEKDEGDR